MVEAEAILEYRQERAAIMEYDAGLPREDAETLAKTEASNKFPALPEIPLRDYQQKSIDMLANSLKTGHKSPVLVVSTGAGKTRTAAGLCRRAVLKGNRVLFITPRRGLTFQASADFEELGIENGVIMAGVEHDNRHMVEVASMDTIISRLGKGCVTGALLGVESADILVIDECFTPDVEILTEKGFVRFDSLRDGVPVAQVDGETEAIDFVVPEVIRKKYSGSMITIKSDKLIDLTMTPNHELLIDGYGKRKKVSVESAKFNANKTMLVAGVGQGSDTELTYYEKLMIAYQADGSLHNDCVNGTKSILFSFSKDRKIKEITRLLNDGGFRWSEVKGRPAEGNVATKRRFHVMGLDSATKELNDVFDLASMSCAKARAIIGYMVHWDGHIRDSVSYYFSSKDKSIVDFYQAVCVLAGYKTNHTLQVDERKENYSDIHRLFIALDKNTIGCQAIKKKTTEYDGMVYCVRVPKGNIVVRRSGRPLVIGNCHLSVSDKRKEFLLNALEGQYATKKIVIGLTASPCVNGGGGLGAVYDDLLVPITMMGLIDQGYLSRPRYFAAEKPDLSQAKITGGDYNKGDLEKAFNAELIMGDVLKNWVRIAENKITVVFTPTRATAAGLVERFTRAGYTAEYVDANTPDSDRKKMFDRLGSGETKIICNVGIIGLGIDIPTIETVVMATATKSVARWMQAVGRAMRFSDGKEHATIIDHGGMCIDPKMGAVEHITEWSLDEKGKVQDRILQAKKERKEPKEITCSNCKTVFKSSLKCPSCGHQMKKKTQDLEVYEADLKEIKAKKMRNLDKPGKQKLWNECLYKASHLGMKVGAAAHMYRKQTGVWPVGLENIPRRKAGWNQTARQFLNVAR